MTILTLLKILKVENGLKERSCDLSKHAYIAMKYTDPQYVLVISGTISTKMDYEEMLEKTQRKRCVSYCCSARSANERTLPACI